MFKRLKDKVFWKTQFDSEWRSAGTFFGFIQFSWPASQKIKEKKYLWREEKGKYYSPRLAVYKAFEEFCNEYYRDNHRRSVSDSEFEEMGGALEYAAPYIDENGNHKEKESFLSVRWLEYCKKYKVRRALEISRRERGAREVESYRFDFDEIDAAWEQLEIGEIPMEASIIWLHSSPRRSAHEIAEKASVSLSDFIFWMCVFKRHLHYTEQIVAGTQMYSRQYDDNSLTSVVADKLKRDAGNSNQKAE